MCKIFHTLFAFIILSAVSVQLPVQARKVNTRLKVEKKSPEKAKEEAAEEEMVSGSFMVASQCPKCNNGYTLDQIVFTGYDKPLNAANEVFFITNNTDRTMSGVTLYVEYLTIDGRQLDKRFVKLSCSIPPGETRRAELKSWDTQRSFYYEKSVQPKRQATPFKVVFDPVAFYLRF